MYLSSSLCLCLSLSFCWSGHILSSLWSKQLVLFKWVGVTATHFRIRKKPFPNMVKWVYLQVVTTTPFKIRRKEINHFFHLWVLVKWVGGDSDPLLYGWGSVLCQTDPELSSIKSWHCLVSPFYFTFARSHIEGFPKLSFKLKIFNGVSQNEPSLFVLQMLLN